MISSSLVERRDNSCVCWWRPVGTAEWRPAVEAPDPHPFGNCPICGAEPVHRPFALDPGGWKLVNVMTCPRHKLGWEVGVGLMSWPDPEPPPATPEEAGLADYQEIEWKPRPRPGHP